MQRTAATGRKQRQHAKAAGQSRQLSEDAMPSVQPIAGQPVRMLLVANLPMTDDDHGG